MLNPSSLAVLVMASSKSVYLQTLLPQIGGYIGSYHTFWKGTHIWHSILDSAFYLHA